MLDVCVLCVERVVNVFVQNSAVDAPTVLVLVMLHGAVVVPYPMRVHVVVVLMYNVVE